MNNKKEETNTVTFAAIFDMDGVIVDNHYYHVHSWTEFCRRHGIKTTDEEITANFGGTNMHFMRHFFGDSRSDDELELMGEEKEVIYREIYAPHIKPLPGLETFLKDLKNHQVPVALATSGPPENVEFVLTRTALKRYFDVLLDASQVINGKPDPEIYLKASAKIGIEPTRCMVFEDSVLGIESANKAGMKVMGIATTHPEHELTNTISNEQDFKKLNYSRIAGYFK